MIPESRRLDEDWARRANWKRWGPYLAERQWATVREDYSADGSSWEYFPHDQARSRAYRWGEDGLLGVTDRECRLCFALALWNEHDPILKERLFGLTGPEGNHGEDVKEEYYYLDSTPTHSYLKALYKYPQREFPYDWLVEENRRRGRHEPEFELADTGVWEGNRLFDVFAEYAKAAPDDLAIRISVCNRGPDTARLHLLPTLWFRNTWSWGCRHEGCVLKPQLVLAEAGRIAAVHDTLGEFTLWYGPAPGESFPTPLFTENETNTQRLYEVLNPTPYVKDAFHAYLIDGDRSAVNPDLQGTKAALHYLLEIAPGQTQTIHLRLSAGREPGAKFHVAGLTDVFSARIREADEFYDSILPPGADREARLISRQAYAGLLWSKQFYHYIVDDWLNGDSAMPPPPTSRLQGRNAEWKHLYNRDILSVPDKWEYPWFAAWDLAFHMLPMARVDPQFAKDQLVLLLREWYMHPNGQIPAYEFALQDVNPPIHAWAAWRVYKIAAPRGGERPGFLGEHFHEAAPPRPSLPVLGRWSEVPGGLCTGRE